MRVKGIWIVVGVVLLVLLYFSSALWIQEKRESNLADARAEAASTGMPVSAADLVRSPPVAPEDNAAIELNELTRLYTEDEERYSVLFDEILSDDLDLSQQVDRDLLFNNMIELQPILEQFVSASKKLDCDFEKDYSLGLVVLYPELARTGLRNVKNAFEPWDTDETLDKNRHPLRAYDRELRSNPWLGDSYR